MTFFPVYHDEILRKPVLRTEKLEGYTFLGYDITCAEDRSFVDITHRDSYQKHSFSFTIGTEAICMRIIYQGLSQEAQSLDYWTGEVQKQNEVAFHEKDEKEEFDVGKKNLKTRFKGFFDQNKDQREPYQESIF